MTEANTLPTLGRLAATARNDLRLQVRNGFYAAVGFLLVVYIVLIRLIPPIDWAYVLPSLLLGNLAVGTFFFIAGQLLLEQQEGTVQAQVTTPLSFGELLSSKVLTLTLLALAENVVITLLTVGRTFDLAALVVGLALASAIYCLTGFAVVSRYDSINQFLFPSIPWVAFANLPILSSLGVWESALARTVMALHPLEPAMTLLEGSVRTTGGQLSVGQWTYATVASLAWIAVLVLWCRARFERCVLARVGADVS